MTWEFIALTVVFIIYFFRQRYLRNEMKKDIKIVHTYVWNSKQFLLNRLKEKMDQPNYLIHSIEHPDEKAKGFSYEYGSIEERNAQIYKLFNSFHLDVKTIAKKYNLSESTIYRIIREKKREGEAKDGMGDNI